MGRKLRYIPEGGALVEVTCRTLQGRLLLRPSPELNDIAAGVLGRAQRLYPVDLVAFSPLSNHYHMIVRAESAKRLARFVGYFNSNLAREVSRLTGWTGKIWETLPGDPDQQRGGSEGCPISLCLWTRGQGELGLPPPAVARPSLRPATRGRRAPDRHLIRPHPGISGPPQGGGRRPSPLRHTGNRDLLTPPLLAAPLSRSVPATRRQQGRRGRAGRRRGEEADGHRTLGAAAILAQAPTSRPKRLKKSPAPHFPLGSFPPALPFVGG
jgi:hypothetical protein